MSTKIKVRENETRFYAYKVSHFPTGDHARLPLFFLTARSTCCTSCCQSNMDLRLSILSFDRVQRALDGATETPVEQHDFNTDSHSLKDIQKLLPSLPHVPQSPMQPWVLLEPWLDLVIRSQGLSSSDIHKIELPRSFLAQSLMMSRVTFLGGHLPRDAEIYNF